MNERYDGNAVVYCEGALQTTNGKTAHGLLRRSEQFRIVAVVDSTSAGKRAGEIVRGARFDVPVVRTLDAARRLGETNGTPLTHLVVGLAPDGGSLPLSAREHLVEAIRAGLHIESGLHDLLSEDDVFRAEAEKAGVHLHDLRKMPQKSALHFFSGKIAEVTVPRVAVLGTDSAVGKRTTAWMLVDAYRAAGLRAELVGTGQTARLQGAKYGVVFDALVNDFVSGEIEHAVWSAWKGESPDIIVVEGQGSLMNPAYPGGLEILAAARPSCIVLQHASARKEYDGFPGYPLHPVEKQIAALELISERKVVAVTVNTEGIATEAVDAACREITERTGLPAAAPLFHGVGAVIDAVRPYVGRGAV